MTSPASFICKKQVKANINQAIPYKDYAEKSTIPSTTLQDELAHKAAGTGVLISDKTIKKTIEHRQNINSTTIDSLLNHDTKVIETEKLIDGMTKIQVEKSQKIDEKHMKIYQAINNTTHHKEGKKIISHVKNLDREI